MENYIELTSITDKKDYFNINHIVNFYRDGDRDQTWMYTSNGHEHRVIETPDEIIKLINKK